MVNVTARAVGELRQRTGIGIMECKKALVKAAGDSEKAIALLRQSGALKAMAKKSRATSEGIVMVKVDGHGAMVEVNCETDFSARNKHLQLFAQAVVDHAWQQKVDDSHVLLRDELEEQRLALVHQIGENVHVRRCAIVHSEGSVGYYVHNNQRIGVLLAAQGCDATLMHDVAMHIAAFNPLVNNASDMPESLIAQEREIYRRSDDLKDKPPHIAEKIIEGKLKKFINEHSLQCQPFVKDNDQTIQALLNATGAQVEHFVRYEVGGAVN